MRGSIKAAAALILTLPLCGGGALAADLTMSPIYAPDPAPMVELGSGWYLRGDIGYVNLGAPTTGAPPSTNGVIGAPTGASLFSDAIKHVAAFGATAGVGYQFNSWLRSDVTFDYRQSQNITSRTNGLACLIDILDPAAPTGYRLTNNGGCYKTDVTQQTSWTTLGNVYGDLGHWDGLTPYIGAGLGLTSIRASGSENWFWNTGAPYGVGGNNFTSQATGATYHYGYPGNIGPSQLRTNFTWALMAGVSYDLAPNVKLDIGYRYMNMGVLEAMNAAGAVVHRTLDTQEVRAGLRITPDL